MVAGLARSGAGRKGGGVINSGGWRLVAAVGGRGAGGADAAEAGRKPRRKHQTRARRYRHGEQRGQRAGGGAHAAAQCTRAEKQHHSDRHDLHGALRGHGDQGIRQGTGPEHLQVRERLRIVHDAGRNFRADPQARCGRPPPSLCVSLPLPPSALSSSSLRRALTRSVRWASMFSHRRCHGWVREHRVRLRTDWHR